MTISIMDSGFIYRVLVKMFLFKNLNLNVFKNIKRKLLVKNKFYINYQFKYIILCQFYLNNNN